MSTEWFCKIMGDQWGPMSSMELTAVARHGRLTRDDLVRKGADGNWVRAELVSGLFQDPPIIPTVTSKSVTSSSRAPLPAKRTLSELKVRQYWVKVAGETAGPFCGAKLRKLAAKGKLKPHYLVSEDKRHWIAASHVNGLVFEELAGQSLKSTAAQRSTLWPLEPIPEESQATPSAASQTEAEVESLVLAKAGQ